jgi:RNA polymerase-binding transcription factor DksA
MKDCTACGEEISPKRVAALPQVELCIDCQEAAEKKGFFKKHVMDVQPVMKAGELEELTTRIVRG